MRSSRSGLKPSVLVLVALLLLSLPLTAGAQTTGGTSGSGSSGSAASTGTTSSASATNGITSPKDMAALSGTVEVRGFATSPNFMKWQLDLLPNGEANGAVFLALGENEGEFTYSLDTSKLPAGEHALRLRVVRQDGNYDEYVTRFTIGAPSAGTTGKGTAGASGAASGGKASSGATTGTGTSGGTATTGTTGGKSTSGGGATTTTSTAGVSTNGLAAPREGQAVSGDFVVRGFASDPNFMKWQLDLLPNGDPNASAFLAYGTNPGVFTYTLASGNLPAGQHALRLRVVRSDSNYNEYTTNFTIGGAPATSGGAGGTGSSAATSGTGTTGTKGTTGGANAGSGAATSGATGTGTSGGTGTGSKAGTGAGTSGGAGNAAGGTGTGSAAGSGGAGQTTNGISAPASGATVSGSVTVRGYAEAANFMKWQLDLLPNGEANAPVFLALGENPGVFTYTLDTTNLPAGQHALRLRVVRSDSNYDEYTTPFTIAK